LTRHGEKVLELDEYGLVVVGAAEPAHPVGCVPQMLDDLGVGGEPLAAGGAVDISWIAGQHDVGGLSEGDVDKVGCHVKQVALFSEMAGLVLVPCQLQVEVNHDRFQRCVDGPSRRLDEELMQPSSARENLLKRLIMEWVTPDDAVVGGTGQGGRAGWLVAR
jgi:hypothetical protein